MEKIKLDISNPHATSRWRGRAIHRHKPPVACANEFGTSWTAASPHLCSASAILATPLR